MTRFDVAIVGAGAAGLAAAAALHRHHRRVVVLEARRRIGGRILTRRDPGLPIPIELGAEFIHGEAPETSRVLSDAGLVACEITGDHWLAGRGKLRRADEPQRIDRVLERIDPDRPDESLADFLARRPGGRTLARDRSSARAFVQGFYAADTERISVRSIASNGGEALSESALRTARVVAGYDQVTEWLARDLRGVLRRNSVVTRIDWRPGDANLAVRGRSGAVRRLTARAVVVTAPIGVLQSPPGRPGAIMFRPDPPRIRDAIHGLAMGSAVRVVFWFRDFPWRRLPRRRPGDLDHMSFLHLRGGPFNVWWTEQPMRSALAVAWSGGPPATALARESRAENAAIALRALAEQIGVPYRRVAAQVRKSWSHDWEHDPFARGAYSYALVGGADAGRALARPVEGTLFFAGEATDQASGTVEGAIASGRRAARQVELALGNGRAQ